MKVPRPRTTLFHSYLPQSGKGDGAAIMFKGEYVYPITSLTQESLREISKAAPGLCPTAIGQGTLSSGGHFFLCTFHNLSSSTNPTAQASEIAKMHSYTNPNGKYGFHVPTCCGSTKMPNDWESSWAQFFAKHRLKAILDDDRDNNDADGEIDDLGRLCVEQVVPRLLGALETDGDSIKPVLLHGDLLVSSG
jgi:protein-ribulosamine 3-kinase